MKWPRLADRRLRLRDVFVCALVLGFVVGFGVRAAVSEERRADEGGQEKEPKPGASPGPSRSPSPSPSPSPTTTPSPSITPTPSPRPRLRLDLEKHVQKHVERDRQPGTPRFQESVEVDEKTPQSMLERHFQGRNLECGGLEGGPPTEVETRAVRPHPAPSVDFVPLLQALRNALGKKKEPRFFLYRITREGKVSYDVRPDRVSDSLLGQPGVQFELLESFSDMGAATKALRRMEQGFDRPIPSSSALPPPAWVTAQPCRPK